METVARIGIGQNFSLTFQKQYHQNGVIYLCVHDTAILSCHSVNEVLLNKMNRGASRISTT
jgi:hypothetical protein